MRTYNLASNRDIENLKSWITLKPTTDFIPEIVGLQDQYVEFEEVMINISEEPIRRMAQEFSLETCSDRPYYESVYYQFKHLLFQYEHKWITSKRQLVLTSKDCLSTIHLVVSENDIKLNCFQRSSNIDNALEEDIKFLCYLLMSVETMRGERIAPLRRSINLFISIPHTFGNKKSKVEQ